MFCVCTEIHKGTGRLICAALGSLAGALGAAATIDLEAKGTHLARVLGAEDVPADHDGVVLAGELVNCQVDKARLAGDSKLMRFVTKIASSAPAKGREKRQLVVSVSAEFPPRLAPPNPATAEFAECGRTDMSYDDADSTFALPVRVLCRKGTDRLVRVQVVWSQSNLVTGGDATVLGESAGWLSAWLAPAVMHSYTCIPLLTSDAAFGPPTHPQASSSSGSRSSWPRTPASSPCDST